MEVEINLRLPSCEWYCQRVKYKFKRKLWEIYNLCSGKKTELKSLANDIKKLLKLENTKISWDKHSYKGIRDSWYGNNSKIKKIGFRSQNPKKSLKKTVEHIFSKV